MLGDLLPRGTGGWLVGWFVPSYRFPSFVRQSDRIGKGRDEGITHTKLITNIEEGIRKRV